MWSQPSDWALPNSFLQTPELGDTTVAINGPFFPQSSVLLTR
jgi:hypothetical protein